MGKVGEYRMKRVWIAVISVLAAALIGAGAWFFLSESRQQAQVEAEHDAVFTEYERLLRSAEGSTLSVLEGGKEIGTFTLHELGLLRETQAAAEQIYSVRDRMPHDAFHALPRADKLTWSQERHPQNVLLPVVMDGFDPSMVLTALRAIPRKAAENAFVRFEDGAFVIHDAVPGTILREDAVTGALHDAAAAFVLTPGAPVSATVEITDFDCYVPPEITAENGDFDLEALFRAKLVDMELTVNFRGVSIDLNSVALRNFVTLGKDGRVQVQKKTLAQQISAWSETYDEHNTEFIFDSFVDGPVPIAFLKVDYTLDQAALAALLEPQLRQLESFRVDAPFLCTKPDGEPFSLGDSYIEVDITNQHMTYYQDGRLVVDTDIVSGQPGGHATPSGLYHSYYKCEDTWLSGEDYFVFVDYWITVTPDTTIGLHDADWRTNFGGEVYLYGGSHGCVNTPKEAMKKIYDTINVDDHIPILVYTHQKPQTTN